MERAQAEDQMRNWMVAMGRKSFEHVGSTAVRTADSPSTRTFRLGTAVRARNFAGAIATSGPAAEAETQRPLQQPLAWAGIATAQQRETESTANAVMATIAAIELGLFTRTT